MLGIVNVKENEYPHARSSSSLYLVDFASKKTKKRKLVTPRHPFHA